MICEKCKKDFDENSMELSHDIPKYIGGEDSDGRHWLCKECHYNYDLTLLNRILKNIGEKLVSTKDEFEKISWMKELSKVHFELKDEFKRIAKKFKEEFYG